MNDREMPPLPDDVTAALAAERARNGVDPVTRARLRARLHASLAAGNPALPEPAAGDGRQGTLRRLIRGLRAVHPALAAGAGFVIGVTAGLGIHARLDATRVRVEVPLVVPANPSPDERATIPPVSVPPAPSAQSEASPSRDVRAEAPAPSAPTLGAERALLDIAHTELAKGEAAAALEGLNRHAQRFPRGVYREEREALIVQSLRALGRTDEAARRAAAFKARYPKSLFLSTVETD